MLRLSTPGNEKFIQADEFDINYGGSEANVAVSLANYGYDTEFVTAIPDNPIGTARLRQYASITLAQSLFLAVETVLESIIWSRVPQCAVQYCV